MDVPSMYTINVQSMYTVSGMCQLSVCLSAHPMPLKDTLHTHNIECMLVYSTDNHLNEYVHPSDNIIRPLTGFTGTNAVLLITRHDNYLYTDGRYFTQARQQLNGQFVLMRMGIDKDYCAYIRDEIVGGACARVDMESNARARVGVDMDSDGSGTDHASSARVRVGVDMERMSMQAYEKILAVGVDVVHVSNDVLLRCGERTFNGVIDMERIRMRECIWLMDRKETREVAVEMLRRKNESRQAEDILNMCTDSTIRKNKQGNDVSNTGNTIKNDSQQKEDISVSNTCSTFNESRQANDLSNTCNILKKWSSHGSIDDVMDRHIAGVCSADKLAIVTGCMRDDECMVLTSLDEIAYLLNARGTDIPSSLLFYAYMFIDRRQCLLFSNADIDRNVQRRPYNEFATFFSTFCDGTGSIRLSDYSRVHISRNASAMVHHRLRGKAVVSDMVMRMKSVKNDCETVGILQANVMDAIALVRLFVWIDGCGESVTEKDVGERLLSIKREVSNEFIRKEYNNSKEYTNGNSNNSKEYTNDNSNGKEYKEYNCNDNSNNKDSDNCNNNDINSITNNNNNNGNTININDTINTTINAITINTINTISDKMCAGMVITHSFEPIIASGTNSAIIHHTASDRVVARNDVLLLDTGSQYVYGTTDITRTLLLGRPSQYVHISRLKDHFTRVLKGQIMAKTLQAPASRHTAMMCDMARVCLWQIGSDYLHGTSHGVGHALNVHESLAFKQAVPHQVFSVEPGVYIEDVFGVRIEDVVLAVGGEYVCTVDMTYLPVQRALIDRRMMGRDERRYVNAYNRVCRRVLMPFLGRKERHWLKRNTRRI